MTPQINVGLASNYEELKQPNETYRLNEKSVDGIIKGIDSIKQSIYHILSTERYSNPIYDDDYGVELEQYIGKDIGFVKADIERSLSEALTQDDRIKRVQVNSVEQASEDSCLVKFTVYTDFGELQEDINVLQ